MKNTIIYKTRQRDTVLSCIKKMKGKHITAEEMVEKLKKENTPVGKSTVYRYLNVLASEGIVKKYMNDDGKSASYQYINDNCSYHLKCNTCGRLYHGHDSILSGITDKINQHYHFEIDNAKTMFYGVCNKCNKVEERKS